MRPILQNLKGRSALDKFFLKMILSTSRSRCDHAKNAIFSGKWSKTQISGQNRIYPSLTLLPANFFPFKRVLKKVLGESGFNAEQLLPPPNPTTHFQVPNRFFSRFKMSSKYRCFSDYRRFSAVLKAAVLGRS